MEKQHEEFMEDALTLKERGNQCIKDGKFKEAALLYTQAIKLDPENFSLYSNRSLAYLKLKLFYLSWQDANETIRLQPQWAKGYFRKAEVELAVGLSDDATFSYTLALQLQPQDTNIIEAIKRASMARKKKKEADEKLPWICSCIGLIIGVVLVIYDYVFVIHESPANPMMQVALALAVAGGGLALGKGYIKLENYNIERSLNPPDTEEEAQEKRPLKFIWMGLAFGFVLIVLDCTISNTLGLTSSARQIVFAIPVAAITWGIGNLIRNNITQKTESDRSAEEIQPEEETSVPERTSNKYTKAQARYRYKKGKM